MFAHIPLESTHDHNTGDNCPIGDSDDEGQHANAHHVDSVVGIWMLWVSGSRTANGHVFSANASEAISKSWVRAL